ncbi:phage tail tip fiber protein, partial [Glaesserella parasuis]|uniref:phage tail tip fiber protein n=1 Tax=Glaesserella parasuis TaxID=738 RepID=UPI0024367C59
QETRARTQALQAEATARGTAVSRLEQADREKAQLIATTTAKADNALSGLSEERQARIAGDNAQAQARAILTTKVASVESGISTLQNSVASANRSVSELSQSLNAKIDGIAIGGWNLIKNSRLLNNTTHWNVIGGRDVRNGIAVLKNLNTANWYWRQTFDLPEKQYTFSAEVKPERTAFYLHLYNGKSWVNFHARNLTPGIWQKISITFVSAIRNISFINPGEGLIELQNPMLVEGNRAMTWAPAPEDIEQSISAVSAELTSHKSTQAQVDKAQSDQLVGLTSRLGTAEATISSTSRTITTLDGKVQSMHTIQAVSIAGNRKALAGISLGSNGGTESSVIVMADKFNVVKNARDGNVKPMFSVVNNKVAINGDLMADGIISARMMAANSIAAGSIQGGAIRANHVAVGELTADKFAVGLGGNLLLNPIFANVNVVDGVPHGWAKGTVNGTVTFRANIDKNYGLRSMGLPNENCIFIRRTDISTTNYAELVQVVPVNRRMWYMASVYMGNHRCVKTELIIEYLNANGTAISATHKTGGNGFTGLETAERVFIKFQAPVNCEKVRFCLRQTGITARNTNALMLVARPMLEECTAHTRDPSPWKNSGVTAIHGGSIVTRSITAKHLKAGTITGNEIASKAISADHIAGKTITADKLSVVKLSALSSELGEITGGSININNRFKVSNTGTVELRSATENVGLVIDNDRITVYDQYGRIRIRIGKLI